MTRIREEELNSIQNVYFQIVIFWKLTEWCRFVTYLWNDPCIMWSACSVRRQWIVHEDAALATRLQDNECEFFIQNELTIWYFCAQISNIANLLLYSSYLHNLATNGNIWPFWYCNISISDFYNKLHKVLSNFWIIWCFSCLKVPAELCWKAASSARRSSGQGSSDKWRVTTGVRSHAAYWAAESNVCLTVCLCTQLMVNK